MDVQFDEPRYAAPASGTAGKNPSPLSALVVRLGLAKDERGAQTILLGVIVLALAVSIGLFVTVTAEPPVEPPPLDL